MGIESSFRKISALIAGGKEPNEAVESDEEEDEEDKEKKSYLKKNETKRFIESFRGLKRGSGG